ncbi:hypothetical protein FJ970_16505 [Mesorhizobium sp. B2-1-8]|uniref:hypothetical protein n=1 Tax=Mesorhizobium sp. B2-1-8 TaxID=2589967 RepID=UPI00112D87AB|nr:hypothetical protein [Mesorhizobium sp. B2-1-8]UCI16770.1 hypothetical protein FJ970_16505 [Mesorhizobium sp. B2-1-8]
MTFGHRYASALMLIAAALPIDLHVAIGSQNVIPPTVSLPADLPGYLQSTQDPASGNSFTRVTKPGNLGNGVVCGRKYCSHRYSSAQAWSADQSLLVISNGCGGMCFLDGHTYAPLFHRDRSGGCEWNPQEPSQMICVQGRAISRWTPRTNREEVIFHATNYSNLQFGPNKGNPSRDGNRIVVRAVRADGKMVAFAYDLKQQRKFQDIDLAQLAGANRACSISPLGTNVLCFQNLEDGTDQIMIFSVDGVLRQKWAEHHRPGHGDMTVDADGSEIYVGISKSEPDKYQVIKRRISDGAVTSLMKYGEAQHASLRALNRPGWVFLSYAGDPAEVSNHPDWAPYAREVIALRTDGSGYVRRIAETRNVVFDYWSETHASPSPDGSQVVWSSNWGAPGGPVHDFVTRVDWSVSGTSSQKEIVANGLR